MAPEVRRLYRHQERQGPGSQSDFDRTRGLDTGELFTFLGATQIDAWYELIKRYGGDQPTAQTRFVDRLAKELDTRGTVDVLRHGVVDQGVTIRLAYFKSAHNLTSELVERYSANRLTATRQLRYESSSSKSIDLALFVNGIPVDAHVVVDRRGQLEKKTAFYIRIGSGTREIIDADERQRYVAHRWGA